MAAESSTLNQSLRLAQTFTGANDGGPRIYRHITRKSSVPGIISSGMSKSMSWPEVYQCLVATIQKDLSPGLHLDMVDTVQLDRLEVKNYSFRDALGTVMFQPKAMQNLESIYEAFMTIAKRLQGDSIKNVAVCYKYGSSAAIILDAETFEALCYETITAPHFGPEIELLQPLIPARGCADAYRSFRTSYWLESLSSIPQMKTEVDVSRAVSRSARVKTQLHRNRIENKLMETIVLQMVNLVESTSCCRVTRAGFDFVQDIHDHIRLLCSTECVVVTSTEGSLKRPTSPGAMKRTRAVHLADLQRAAKDDMDLRIELQNTLAREHRRRPSTALGTVTNTTLNSHLNSNPNSNPGRPGTTMRRTEQQLWVRKGGRPHSPNTHIRPVVPDATFGDETRHLPLTATLLGSSQLHGICPGDFCAYNVDAMNPLAGSVSSSSSTLKMSSFRRKWAQLSTESSVDEVEVEEEEEVAERRRKAVVRKGATFRTRYMDAAALAVEAGRVLGESEPACPTLLISYRSILQARQEMPLVKAQLSRHAAGGKGEYVSEESVYQMKEVSELSAKMAAIYYCETPVCSSCYKVYTIVDGARQKAMKKLYPRKTRPLTAPAHARPNARTQTAPAVSSDPDLDPSPDPSPDLDPGTDPSPEVVWSVQAIDGITPRDVSDIRRMASPHAAVEVVVEAVLVVLTGRWMPFRDARRLLHGDTFLALLKAFRAEDLSDAALRMVESYTDNPLFRPHQLARVNACAAKFCAWVLGVVQAAKDGRFRRLSRHVSNQSEAAEAEAEALEQSEQNEQVVGQVGHGGVVSGVGRVGEEPGVAVAESVPNVRVRAEHAQAATHSHSSLAVIVEDMTDVDETATATATAGGAAQTQVYGSEGDNAAGSHPAIATISTTSPTPASTAAPIVSTNSTTKTTTFSTLPTPIPTKTQTQTPIPTPAPTLTPASHPDKENNHAPTHRPRPSAPSTTRVGLKPPMSGGPLPPTLPPTLDEASFTAERQRVIKKAMAVSQKRAADRLSAMREALYIPAAAGAEKEFRCSDSFTSLRYVVAGNFSVTSPVCNFVLVHDFFDTVEATALLMKHITSHHEGCQAVCFNYPGQSGTEWAHLGGAERARGAVEPVHNNDWIADRLHELLQHTEAAGEILLSTPFHLVGMGNGACVAAAFAQRWGAHPSYAHSLRSFVSVNGFLNPDPQLRAILHSAAQVALSASPTRPDIPVSFWTKFVFSDEYLKKVPRSLALHTYTAVSNLITNEGRGKIARGALQHRDVRGGLDPRNGVRTVVATVTADVGHAGGGGVDVDASGGVGESAGANASGSAGGGGATASTGASATTSASINAVAGASVSSVLTLAPVRVPVIVLQSTENLLVSPTHVDAFVSGRTTHHLFSHQLNLTQTPDPGPTPATSWVGRTATGPHDYPRHSALGPAGLRLLLGVVNDPKGALVVWVKAGHCVQQEGRAVLLDLLDALARPSAEYVGDVFLGGAGAGGTGAGATGTTGSTSK